MALHKNPGCRSAKIHEDLPSKSPGLGKAACGGVLLQARLPVLEKGAAAAPIVLYSSSGSILALAVSLAPRPLPREHP